MKSARLTGAAARSMAKRVCLTGGRAPVWSAAMPQDDPKEPRARPQTAAQSTDAAAKSRSGGGKDREARLAEALRANLRRRKAAPRSVDESVERAAGEKEEDR